MSALARSLEEAVGAPAGEGADGAAPALARAWLLTPPHLPPLPPTLRRAPSAPPSRLLFDGADDSEASLAYSLLLRPPAAVAASLRAPVAEALDGGGAGAAALRSFRIPRAGGKGRTLFNALTASLGGGAAAEGQDEEVEEGEEEEERGVEGKEGEAEAEGEEGEWAWAGDDEEEEEEEEGLAGRGGAGGELFLQPADDDEEDDTDTADDAGGYASDADARGYASDGARSASSAGSSACVDLYCPRARALASL
jgi:hypothetical protein